MIDISTLLSKFYQDFINCIDIIALITYIYIKGSDNMRLKEARKQAGMTQQQVAAAVGVNQNTYSYWENEKTKIDNISLGKLAQIFNVTVDYLLGAPPENKKIPKDLKKILEDEEVTLNGRMLSEDEKEQMLRIVEALYWDAKEKNKRK